MLEHPSRRPPAGGRTVEVSDATRYTGDNAISADNQQERLMTDVEKLGKVEWGFKHTGYKSGLEEIDKNHPVGSDNFMPIHVLCREVAIAKSGGGLQFNFIKHGNNLVESGVLKPEELQYIYEQFEFNPDTFVLPEFLQGL